MLHDIFLSVMRVRATRGIRITNFYGNYLLRGTDLLALPNCTADSSFAVDLGYDEVKKPYICSNSLMFLLPILLHFILFPMNCPFLSFPISISISLTSSLSPSLSLSLSPSHFFTLSLSISLSLFLLQMQQMLSAQAITVQAALLYTSSLGERRIRVHTMVLPVTQVRLTSYQSYLCAIKLIKQTGMV